MNSFFAKLILLILSTTAFSFFAEAALVKSAVEYKDQGTKLKGYMVYDDSKPRPQPGILVVHNWMGLSDETKSKADSLAALGYTAFAVDVYGEGNLPKDSNEAGALATKFKSDRKLFRSRLLAALNALKKQKDIDAAKLGAIGYCFGGTGAIELARAGAPLKGVVSFHGGLDSPKPGDGANIKAKVLALHGADDPFVKREDLNAFEDEMRSHKIDWRLIKYGNAVHSFTEKAAGNDNSKGAAYNEAADQHSWQDMKNFFAEVL
jgi:dienelactone hydrolase